MTFVVGLTGGIGSGKTLVSDRLAELGVPVIDTDVVARQIVAPGAPALRALVKQFGDEILDEDGSLNRDRLRELAFSSPENKQALDGITHPAIRAETLRQLENVNYPYCVIVIPLLSGDSPFTAFLNRVVTVSCERETRITRVMQRNDFTRQQVLNIMDTQLTDQQRESFADDVIHNNGSKAQAIEATDELHQTLLAVSSALSSAGHAIDTSF